VKVLSYFTALDHPHFECERRLTERWLLRWSKLGFSPICLGDHSIDREKWILYLQHFEKMPTVNMKPYEMACWLRWCAYADFVTHTPGALTEPFLVCDYDVFNTGLKPDRFLLDQPRVTAFDDRCIIGCMRFNRVALRMMPVYMKSYSEIASRIERGRNHSSDMFVVQLMNEMGMLKFDPVGMPYSKRSECACLIHICNDVVMPMKKTKLQVWEELEEEFPLCQ
jgi:hypothetical protein